jgi:hypothetical protein
MQVNDIDRINKVTEGRCLHLVNFVVGRLVEPPPETDSTGCVIAAGGPYLRPAWGAIHELRRQGWQHPIQIWHIGPKEIAAGHARKFKRFDVEFVDGQEVRKRYPMRTLSGWTLKGFAAMRSPFRHVLLLDADSFVQRNMAMLFKTKTYQKNGIILTPDIKKNRPNDNIFPLLGLKVPENYQEAESGQIMVDKVRNWKAVQLMNWMNSHAEFFYRWFLGDKETWPLSFLKLEQPFELTPSCKWVGYGMQHFWYDHSPMAVHATEPKRRGGYPKFILDLFDQYDNH